MKAVFFGLASLALACPSGGSGGGGFGDSGVGGSGATGFGGFGATGTGGSGATGATGTGGTGGAPGCAAGEMLCGAACIKVKDDSLHCGSCDKQCNTGDVCNNWFAKPSRIAA